MAGHPSGNSVMAGSFEWAMALGLSYDCLSHVYVAERSALAPVGPFGPWARASVISVMGGPFRSGHGSWPVSHQSTP